MMSAPRTSVVPTALAIAALLLALAAVPSAAAEELPVPPASVVSGDLVLPDGSPPLAESSIHITINDKLRAGAQSGIIASLTMVGTGGESPIPFALSVVPAVLAAAEIASPLDVTLEVWIESTDGSRLYESDVDIGAATPDGPITDLEIPLVVAQPD